MKSELGQLEDDGDVGERVLDAFELVADLVKDMGDAFRAEFGVAHLEEGLQGFDVRKGVFVADRDEPGFFPGPKLTFGYGGHAKNLIAGVILLQLLARHGEIVALWGGGCRFFEMSIVPCGC